VHRKTSNEFRKTKRALGNSLVAEYNFSLNGRNMQQCLDDALFVDSQDGPESTINAVPFYGRMVFRAAAELSLNISVQEEKGHSTAQRYHEFGMVYRPQAK
jgi:hypothetical protein